MRKSPFESQAEYDRRVGVVVSEVIENAEALARMQGSAEYLAGLSKTLTESMAAVKLPETYTFTRNGYLLHTKVRMWTPSGKRRNISRNALKQKYPHAYRAVVTEAPPEKPYQVRLEAKQGRAKSQHWAALRAEAAANLETHYRALIGTEEWTRPSEGLRYLYEVRENARRLKEQITKRRDAITLLITDHELPLETKLTSDGKITLRENAPKISVDYDLLERQYPAAAALITRTPIASTPRIVMRPFDPNEDADDEHELDEDDYADSFWD